MKSFFKDYGKLWEHSWQFVKDHWLGNIIFMGVVAIVEMFIYFPKWPIYIWEKIQDVFSGVKDYFEEKRARKAD